MKILQKSAWTLLAAALLPAVAHHSFAMFDRTRTVLVDGTLYKIELVRPHSWYWVMAPDASGKVVKWGAEGGGPQEGQSATANYFVPGVKVKLMLHPYRDGRLGGQFIQITSEDGMKKMGGQVNFGDPTPPVSTPGK